MKLTLVFLGALASAVLAAGLNSTVNTAAVPSEPSSNSTNPSPSSIARYPHCRPRKCLTQRFADKFVSRFSDIQLHQSSDLGTLEQTLDIMLAEDFEEISGSINSLAGHPLDGISAPSKEAYIQGITHAPANAGIETIFTYAAGCRNIIWHWEFTGVGSKKYPVKGFNFFELDERCQICRLQLEFNSIAWGLDTGYQLVWPNGTVQSKRSEGAKA